MSSYYPIFVSLSGKKVVIIGGGVVATRKVQSLLPAAPKITIISPTVTEEIKHLVEQGSIHWKQKQYEEGDITEAFLVFAATNDHEVNETIANAISENQLANIVDIPQQSSFIVPATVRRGKLIIATSTSGASPGLARKIKRDIAANFDDSYTDYVDFLANCRLIVKEQITDISRREAILKALLEPKFLQWTKENNIVARETEFARLLNLDGDGG